MPDDITSLTADREKLTARAATSRAEISRLSKLLFPHYLDVTVVNVDLPVKISAAVLGAPSLAITGTKPGIVTTAADEENAARNAEIIKQTIAGHSLNEKTSNEEKLNQEHRQLAAIESAIEFVDRELYKQKHKLAVEHCKNKRPEHDAIMRRLYAALLETHSAWSELYALKRELIDTGIGLHGICQHTPETFLSTPNNAYSPMADFFREGLRHGWTKKIPAEYAGSAR
jgi:hypothetical protein